MNKTKYSFFNLPGIAIIITILSGCMYGGGTIGTGITGYGTSTKQDSYTQYTLTGHIHNSTNMSLGGFNVLVSNSHFNQKTTVGKDGRFQVKVKTVSGEPIDFVLTKGNLKLKCTAYISPAGENIVLTKFEITNSKELICP